MALLMAQSGINFRQSEKGNCNSFIKWQKGNNNLTTRLSAEQCIRNPELLHSIVAGFESKDKKLQSDCIEVFTIISVNYPELIVPFADKVSQLINNTETKTRWEAVHTLAFIADKTPETIFSILPELQNLIEKDKRDNNAY